MSDAPHRDDSLDRLIETAVRRRSNAPAADACPDAEMVAAWMDGGLSEAESAHVDAHLADCARCQALLAAMTAAIDDAAGTASTAPATVVPMRRPSPMRWLAPVAAGLAAASLIFYFSTGDGEPLAPESSLAQADAVLMREAVPPSTADAVDATAAGASAPAADRGATTQKPASPAARGEQTAAKAAEPTAGQQFRRAVAGEPPPPPPPSAAGPPPATGRGAAGAAAPPTPTPLPRPTPTSAAQTVQTQTATTATTVSSGVVQTLPRADRNALEFTSFIPGMMVLPGTTIEFGPPGDALYRPPPPPPLMRTVGGVAGGAAGARAAGGGGGRGGGARQVLDRTAAGETAKAPIRVRWRILPSGEVERSTNGGSTWTAVTIDPPVIVTQGAAPSANVCWLIGRGGVVLLATEGTNFKPVPFPVRDVTALLITATDARHATINLSDGRALATTDGGQTWR